MNSNFVDYVEPYKDEAGEWRWRAKSNNGNTLADSGESYSNKADMQNAVAEIFPGVEVREEE